MSSPPSGTRYCPTCGSPTTLDKTACPRCGNPLPALGAAAPPPGYAAPGGGMPAGKGGFPGWVIGVIACVVAAPILVGVLGVVAAIAIPNFIRYQARAKSAQAAVNLAAIWTAEKSWAASHGGEYSEFDIDETDQSDSGFTALGVTLAKPLHHGYSAYYLGDTLWISASGNIDEDATLDEWEISSDDPTPFHYSDDVTEVVLPSRQPADEGSAADEEYEGTEGGVVGGVVGGTADLQALSAQIALQQKSESARENLEAIWKAEQAYKAKHKSWLAFTDGNGTTWAALGVTLPAEKNHAYSARVAAGALTLTATANLDDDEFEDAWKLESSHGFALQDKSDALNLDLSSLAAGLKKGE